MKVKNPMKKKPKVKSNKDNCAILFSIQDGNLRVSVDWDKDVNPRMVGALIGAIANTEVLIPALNEVEKKFRADGKLEELEEVHETIKYRILQHRQATIGAMERQKPVVSPINAIYKQLTMYQPQRD